MNRKINSLFGVKNGRMFHRALIRASHDPNVGKMFMDNLDADRRNIVTDCILNGDFRSALFHAFTWEDSNEKEKFWREIYLNLKDYLPEPVKK